MSNTKMLIDATHPEETRVVVQRNGRVEEFDFESAARKLLRGNIYLAKVTRVEPSLQAAFVDYGGNRHGFLAFNEIHPDYYQIPVADRQALIDEEAAAEAELEAAADRRAEALARRSSGQRTSSPDEGGLVADSDHDEHEAEIGEALPDTSHIVDVEEDEHIEEVGGEGAIDEAPQTIAARIANDTDTISEPLPTLASESDISQLDRTQDHENEHTSAHHHETEDDEADGPDENDENQAVDQHRFDDETSQPADNGYSNVDTDGHHDDAPASSSFQEEAPQRQRRRPRSYKIQEVIKRRQVILVQVVKEERGNKGAALTTYLSLAGRYTVLMPNTARGGGISRKITNPQDRKRLKSIAQELEVPEGMGLIIRTAGAARTKQEIKRDFEYLLRLWESVRDLTLQSTAPSLVYEEGDLIKRSIRDLYNKDVEEVVVAGDAGHQEAADFMRMLMPSHSKNVIAYREPTPLFTRYGVERQLNAMFLPQVTLRSGGYIVINQTEALVAIDVNSGKSTREFSIEETALATNLEASDEIARQLKLRDLAGLIVIDFIDMEEKRNNRAVERRLKDALRFDRARIQLGRISHFGLMEMSRQRLRTGVLEGSTSQCPHCQGTGIIRSTESIALAVLRGLEDAITAGANAPLIATTTPAVALYILNSKRAYVTDMEARHGYSITILGSDRVQGANFTVERGAASALPARRPDRAAVNMNWGFEGEGEDEAPSFEGAEIEIVGDPDDLDAPIGADQNGRERSEEDGGRRGRRRRRGRGRGQRGERDDQNRNDFRSNPRPQASHDDDDNDGPERALANVNDTQDDVELNAEDRESEIHGDSSHEAERLENGSADRQGRRRRRGRRGGRRGRERSNVEQAENGHNAGHDGSQTDLSSSPSSQDDEPMMDEQPHAHDMSASKSTPNERRAGRSRDDKPRQPRIWDAPAREAIEINSSTAEPVAVIQTPNKQEQPAQTAEPKPFSRRHEIGSSEPRVERVVVRPDLNAESSAEATPAATERKGWWQRRFGGE
ncbi:MAG: ribonuclease E [Hyphomicrobium sp.]|nr:MAG: ribonuclease E [Hyphomicrobium sp.]PPD01371.1 MAG: ribonuclease E [Hyphomicrobium sp.]